MKTGILKLQEEYLQTFSDATLSQLYEELLKLGFAVSESANCFDKEQIYDIVSDIVMRLREKKEVIIKSAPSSFLRHSIFYSNNNLRNDKENQTIDLSETEATEDEYFPERNYDEFVEELLLRFKIPEDIRQAVEYCLFARQPASKIQRKLKTRRQRAEFSKLMKEVYEYVSTKDL